MHGSEKSEGLRGISSNGFSGVEYYRRCLDVRGPNDREGVFVF